MALKLNAIKYTDNGHRIVYDYTLSDEIESYFESTNLYYVEYDQDISDTPLSLSVIPLLSNIMPISWFVGFDVYIDEIDETFFKSLDELKKQFIKFHPDKKIKGELHVNKITTNNFNKNNSSLLFSGGLDSYDSLTRNFNKNPYLISIHGADVKIEDTKRWIEFKKFNADEKIIDHSKLFYIESNLREFYTYKVDLLVNQLGWWGTVQHGMALLGVLAPLTNKYGITDVNIAASATNEITYSWGSSPSIDENMKWANTQVTHDGYEFKRTEKVDNVVNFVKKTKHNIKLRVCFADERTNYNCNVCHKCQRTIFSLLLSGANPVEYGFDVPNDFYELIFENFDENCIMTKGIKYQWTCLQDKAKLVDDFFIIKSKETEKKHIENFINLDLDKIVNKNKTQVIRSKRAKFILKNRFPYLFNFFKKFKG